MAAVQPGGDQAAAAQPGGPQPVGLQPGGVQAAAAQPGVGLGTYPGKSILKKGL